MLTGCLQEENKTSCKTGEIYDPYAEKCIQNLAYENPPALGADQTVILDEGSSGKIFNLSQGEFYGSATKHYILVDAPSNGDVSNCFDSSDLTETVCNYTPDSGYAGTDTLTYKLFNGVADSISVATVTFAVTPVENLPTLSPTPSTTNKNKNEHIMINYTPDEGGGADEIGQNVSIRVISSNTVILPNAEIKICYDKIQTHNLEVLHAQHNTSYVVNIDGADYTYTSSSDRDFGLAPTTSDIATGIATLLNAITNITASNTGNHITIEANTSATLFTISTTSNLLELTETTDAVYTCGLGGAIYLDLLDGDEDVNDGGNKQIHLIMRPMANLTGETTITIDVNDGIGTQSYTYKLEIEAENIPPIFTQFQSDFSIPEDAGVLGRAFVVDEGSGVDEDSQSLFVMVYTDDTTLIDNANININYDGVLVATAGKTYYILDEAIPNVSAKNLTLDITPTADQYGTATIFMTITDTINYETRQFNVHVLPDNDFPVLTGIPGANVVCSEDLTLGTCTVTLNADEGGGTLENPQELKVTITSNNTALIPNTGIGVTYGASNWTDASAGISLGDGIVDANLTNLVLSFTPTSELTGTSIITVILEDEDDAASVIVRNFTVQIDEDNDAPTITNIANYTTNAGTPITNITTIIDEGGANVAAENNDQMQIQVTSSNVGLIPNESIEIYYAGTLIPGGGAAFLNLEAPATASCDAQNVTLNLNPNPSESGTSIITVEASDGTTTSQIQFIVNVNSASIIHGGWSNIISQGPKYNRSYDFDPQTNPIEDVIAQFSWNDFTVTGGITQHEKVQIVTPVVDSTDYTITINSTASTISSGVSATESSIAAALKAQIESDGEDVTVFKNYNNTLEIFSKTSGTAFTISASSNITVLAQIAANATSVAITGWNIYRTDSINGTTPVLTDFDTSSPINTSPVTLATTSYDATDTSVTPINNISNSDTGNVYWYIVAGILDNDVTNVIIPASKISIIRMVVPPQNMVLIHRLSANIDICTKINSTMDPNNFNRCAYRGPGDTYDAGTGSNYYDFGKDLLVDRFEAGCNVANSNLIGAFDPDGIMPANVEDLFYRRDTGECYINSSVGAPWTAWTTLSSLETGVDVGEVDHVASGADLSNLDINYGLLPPITKVSQQQAQTYCSSVNTQVVINDANGVYQTITRSLLGRKEFMVAAQWDSTYNNSQIHILEGGSDLDNGPKCNTNNLDLVTKLTFDDINLPQTEIDTLPATLTAATAGSFISPLRTGGDSTTICKSKYGISDIIGNIREWGTDRMTCASNEECSGANNVAGTNTFQFNNATKTYNFDAQSAAAVDMTGPSGDGGALTNWLFTDTTTFNSTYFYYPMGLPAVTTAIGDTKKIGVDVENIVFQKDRITVTATAGETIGITLGGDYNDINGAGAFNFEFSTVNPTETKTNEIGFRCSGSITY